MISICIPFRHDDHRRRLLEWCVARWQKLLPEAELVIADDPERPGFNRARARNRAAQQAIGDVLIFADADTTIDAQALHLGVVAALTWPWVIPYKVYYNVDADTTRKILISDEHDIPVSGMNYEHVIPYPARPPYGEPVSGVLIMNRDAFQRVGGYDENFEGWGYEDTDFALAATKLVGPAQRVKGAVYHLWHPIPAGTTWDSPTIEANKERHKEYLRAYNDPDPEAMRKLKGVSRGTS